MNVWLCHRQHWKHGRARALCILQRPGRSASGCLGHGAVELAGFSERVVPRSGHILRPRRDAAGRRLHVSNRLRPRESIGLHLAATGLMGVCDVRGGDMRRLWIGLLVVVCVPALAEAQKRGLLPQDYYRIVAGERRDRLAAGRLRRLHGHHRRRKGQPPPPRSVGAAARRPGARRKALPLHRSDARGVRADVVAGRDAPELHLAAQRRPQRDLVRAARSAERRGVSHRRRRRARRCGRRTASGSPI